MLASQELTSLELDAGPALLEELCRSLNSRPEVRDPEFPGAFPAPNLAHLELRTGLPSKETGVAILEILTLRQSRLRALPGKHAVRFATLKLSKEVLIGQEAQDWRGLVDEKEGSFIIE